MTVVSSVEIEPAEARVRGLRQSPLGSRAEELAVRSGKAEGVDLVEEAFLTQVNLRMDPDDPAVARVESVLGTRLSEHAPNTVRGDEHDALLWLGPDEWLVLAPEGRSEVLVSGLRSALGDSPGSVVDVSANRTTLRLSGARARDVLAKSCSLDLHPRVFGPGHCAQTLVGRTQVVLWQVGAEPSYRLLVRCSFANYLADVLLDGMVEFTAD
ncbi:sarcosine oxidase subunit gamma [Parasphingorhabdus pacifica]